MIDFLNTLLNTNFKEVEAAEVIAQISVVLEKFFAFVLGKID